MMNGFILSILFLASSLQAAEFQLTRVQGAVRLHQTERSLKAKAGTSLREGDRISTGADGQAVLSWDDGSAFKINASSELTVQKQGKSIELFLKKGEVVSRVRKVLAPKFKLRTEAAVIGVRETLFFTGVKVGDGVRGVRMCVREGSVQIDAVKTGQSVLVPEGQGVFVPEGGKIGHPTSAEWSQKLDWSL